MKRFIPVILVAASLGVAVSAKPLIEREHTTEWIYTPAAPQVIVRESDSAERLKKLEQEVADLKVELQRTRDQIAHIFKMQGRWQ